MMIDFTTAARTAGTTTNTQAKTLTLTDLEATKRLLDNRPPCPIAEYMRQQGADPALGWTLLLPNTPEFRQMLAFPFPPAYVCIHPLVTKPTLVLSRMVRDAFKDARL